MRYGPPYRPPETVPSPELVIYTDRVPAEPVVSRHQTLRAATAASHATLDAAVGGFGSIGEYCRYLAAMHAFRVPVEKTLAASGGAIGGITPPPMLASALAADMADLGLTAAVPTRPRLAPFLRTPSGLAGALYVLEGSAVGARLLVRRAAALGLGAHHGARHLAAQADDRERWPHFLHALEAMPAFDMGAAVRAAAAVFGAACSAFLKAHDDAA